MKSKLDEAFNSLIEKGYNVVYIGYYGAHNYNLADEKSDYDFKAIIIPTLTQLIKREVISLTLEFSFGNIDVKDLITFTSNIGKGNFSYIESLTTPYYIDKGKELLDISIREFFKNAKVNYMSMVGAIKEKRKALTHEYPSKHEEFEKYYCDPKQFLQAIRLYDILRDRSYSPSNYNLAYKVYADEGVQFELLEFESESSSRKYEFTREELIEMKRKLLMPLEETIQIFDYIQIKAREYLPKDYKFTPVDYMDDVINLLVFYFSNYFKSFF